MTNQERVEYLANLAILLEYYEKLGAPRNQWVVREYATLNDELIEALKEKHKEKVE